MFFNVALLGKKINKICIQANSKQDVNTIVKATHDSLRVPCVERKHTDVFIRPYRINAKTGSNVYLS